MQILSSEHPEPKMELWNFSKSDNIDVESMSNSSGVILKEGTIYMLIKHIWTRYYGASIHLLNNLPLRRWTYQVHIAPLREIWSISFFKFLSNGASWLKIENMPKYMLEDFTSGNGATVLTSTLTYTRGWES